MASTPGIAVDAADPDVLLPPLHDALGPACRSCFLPSRVECRPCGSACAR